MALFSQQEHSLEAQIYLIEVCFTHKEPNLVVVSRSTLTWNNPAINSEGFFLPFWLRLWVDLLCFQVHFFMFQRFILNSLSYYNMPTCRHFILQLFKIVFVIFFFLVVVGFLLDELLYYRFHWCVCALIRMCEIGKNVRDHIEQLLCMNEI